VVDKLTEVDEKVFRVWPAVSWIDWKLHAFAQKMSTRKPRSPNTERIEADENERKVS